MANQSFDRNIFGRKINTPHKNVRKPAQPTAVTAMHEISAYREAYLQAVLDEKNVKEGYRKILMVLGKEDGISQLSIAKQIRLKPSTVSIALKKMEREGYITRVNDLKDMRMSRVYLTETGLEIANLAYDVTEKLGEALMEGISEAELQTVLSVVEKMKANYIASEFAKDEQ